VERVRAGLTDTSDPLAEWKRCYLEFGETVLLFRSNTHWNGAAADYPKEIEKGCARFLLSNLWRRGCEGACSSASVGAVVGSKAS